MFTPRYLSGVVCGALAAICYGMNPLGAVSLYQAGFGIGTVLMFRFGFAAILLGGFMLLTRTPFKMSRHEFGVTAMLGGLFAVSSLTFYASFLRMDVGIACTILFVYPVMTAMLMSLLFGERLRVGIIVSALLALVGIAVLSLGGGEYAVTPIGVGLVLVSALTYAVYIVIVNRARLDLSVGTTTFWVISVCFFFIGVFSVLTEGVSAFRMPVAALEWLYAGFLGLVPTLLSLVFLTLSVNRVGSTTAAILGALEPVAAVAIAVVAFGEVFTLRLAVGILIVLSAVILVVSTGPNAKLNNEA